jgi:undecaprenyl pyrophosphate synthase
VAAEPEPEPAVVAAVVAEPEPAPAPAVEEPTQTEAKVEATVQADAGTSEEIAAREAAEAAEREKTFPDMVDEVMNASHLITS